MTNRVVKTTNSKIPPQIVLTFLKRSGYRFNESDWLMVVPAEEVTAKNDEYTEESRLNHFEFEQCMQWMVFATKVGEGDRRVLLNVFASLINGGEIKFINIREMVDSGVLASVLKV